MELVFINNDDFSNKTKFKQKMEMRLAGFLDDAGYFSRTMKLCQDPDTYVMLDNGAAEALVPSNIQLREYILDLHPDEFVLPDVLRDPIETFKKSKEFYYDWVSRTTEKPKFNYVLHAKDYSDWLINIYNNRELHTFLEKVDVVSIPKYIDLWGLTQTEDGKTIRDHSIANRAFLAELLVDAMNRNEIPKKEIHFLGANSFDTVFSVKNTIRSCDTALPYIGYALDRYEGNMRDYVRNLGIEMKFLGDCGLEQPDLDYIVKMFNELREELKNDQN